MGKLHRLRDVGRPARRPHRQTFFSRAELNQLLSLYSRRVMSGEWRDYAIDQQGDTAMFSVYRHAHERPLYTIAKKSGANGRGTEFWVCRDRERLASTACLAEALTVFRPALRVVS
ncbi:MAG: DUF2794 domain-containing protein [Pseudomonadota bacterium]